MFSNTYTLLARDSSTGQLGIAVASRYLAVGSVVPFIRPGVGAVATQHHHDPRIAYAVLDDLEAGVDPRDAVERALKFFGDAHNRQVAVMLAEPNESQAPVHVHTGMDCQGWCGERVSPDLIVLGNTLVGPDVLAEAERAFLSSGSPHLSERLLEGLIAGERSGGDKRGKQAAALKVMGKQMYAATDIDLRVDDHPEAQNELHRLWIMHRKLLGTQFLLRAVRPEPKG